MDFKFFISKLNNFISTLHEMLCVFPDKCPIIVFAVAVPPAVHLVLLTLDVQNSVKFALVRYTLSKVRERNDTILDRFLDCVKRHPHKPFILFEDESYSYLDTDRQSNKVARALQQHTDIKEGDTVAILFGNQPFFLWIWLGLVKLGCSAALLNYNMRSRSLLHCFSCSGANVLIAGKEYKEVVEEILPTLTEQKVKVFVLADQCTTAGMETFSDKIRQASSEPIPVDVRSNVRLMSPAVYIYTSGTTGLPKAAVLTHLRLWNLSFVQSTFGVSSTDVFYLNLPLYHTSGLMAFTGTIERGSTLALRSKFSASHFWDDCRKYNVTVIHYIGETMRYLCSTQKRPSDRNHKVRMAIGNGVRADVWREFLNRFGHISVKELYGSTEGNIGLSNYTGKVGAVGRVNFFHKWLLPYAIIKYDIEKEEPLRNSEGFCVEAATGEAGLLISQISQKAPFIGYARDPKQTEKKRLHDVFVKGDQYFNTGDLLWIDEENFIYFQDRIGDTFRWKGENVATNEVSDILTTMPSIQEANVYGVKVPGQEGRAGMAALRLKEGEPFDGTGTFRHVSRYLPAYARPRFIRIQNCLTVTGTFKHRKVKLVEEGFKPDEISDRLYILDDKDKCYVPLTQRMYDSVVSGMIKL
ncbi:very long-chain acyl-CoA synthetase isoform X1 [Esox lucius]|uniref:long-chain-fatty-acid--CoA ligase n=2 Tax=Esox lucius TaxID=8010 RepID=A0A3P8XHL7_ESOLU|nr:very long-chain acyl-CoA synthetase isoform X1 [Esox lucius]